jgi:hypothetical protein
MRSLQRVPPLMMPGVQVRVKVQVQGQKHRHGHGLAQCERKGGQHRPASRLWTPMLQARCLPFVMLQRLLLHCIGGQLVETCRRRCTRLSRWVWGCGPAPRSRP